MTIDDEGVRLPDVETVGIIVHGSHCPNWTNPQTTEEWLAAQLVKDDVAPGDWDGGDSGASGVWRCPFCKQAVYIFLSGGEIDFGMEPSLGTTDEQAGAFIETFEPLVSPFKPSREAQPPD